ncbi:hypothetical protein [Nocardia vermiculata]|uniref:Uncharacterized protein n=1 Tax=Nocardia vermiculata TaxID=257274 RepID=A0A846XXS5_9NOCA|nr:hypothetical protein [Nocardia vermiculata]NKY50171.1 hypothetical protein [Nocardia vermiculata]
MPTPECRALRARLAAEIETLLTSPYPPPDIDLCARLAALAARLRQPTAGGSVLGAAA